MKKIVGVLLLTLICAGIFVGCGTQNGAKYAFPSDASVMLNDPKSEIISKFGLTDSVDTNLIIMQAEYGTKDIGKTKYKIGSYEAVYSACSFEDNQSLDSFQYTFFKDLNGKPYTLREEADEIFTGLKKILESIYGSSKLNENNVNHKIAKWNIELQSGEKYLMDLEIIPGYEQIGAKDPSVYIVTIIISSEK